MIKPHGDFLVNKILSWEESKQILDAQNEFVSLPINLEQVKDVKNIARGVYSPLEGFLKQEDFEKAVLEMKLSNGIVWSIPIVLDISNKDYERIRNKKEIILTDSNENPVALLKNIEVYPYDKNFFANNVFGTSDRNHPGVEGVYQMGNYLIGGEIGLLDNTKDLFPEYNFTPEETREIFQKRGWDTVVAFQTRNVPHRGHEFLQKYALENIDGLFIQPVIGEKKLADFKDEYILTSYEILINKYYPKNKVLLGILPLKMRYAGPREAIFHALIRKNFGCTHFIVGRDHAGVANYYPPFAAQEIFDKFKKEEIGIDILKYPEVVYCQSKRKHTFINECPEKDRISFSGTKLRDKVKNKEEPPSYIIRTEVYHLLANSYNSLVDSMYQNQNHINKKGFVLWLTGLSQSGKTTIGDRVYEILKSKNIKVERLDGDIVRESLTKDLGFSKEDRDENIRRIGFIAKLLSRNGVGVIASFISPYREQRDKLRKDIENFIEVFVNAPLEICEKRDDKGLYEKARKGEIKNFTGISDPYETPENPEIELKTDQDDIAVSVEKVIKYLEDNDFLEKQSPSMKKILMLNYEFPPLGGGAGNATYYLLKEFSKYNNLEIDLVTSSTNKYCEEQFADNIKIYYLDIGKGAHLHHQSNKDLLKYSWQGYWFCKKLIRQQKYNLIHAFFGVPCGYIAMKLGLPYIISLRGSDVPGHNPKFSKIYLLLSPLIKNVWEKAKKVIANSNDLKNTALKTNSNQKIEVILNGVDCGKFKPAANLKKKNRFKILYVGRLHSAKGIEYLIEAFRKFKKIENNIELIIVGDGPLYRKIKEKENLTEFSGSLKILGRKGQQDLIKIYQESDIFVLPSSNEGMSNTILEAMACGLPIIATDTGDNRKLIKDNGIIIKTNDSESILNALEELYSNQGYLDKMRIISKKRAEKMNWQRVAGEYLKIYKNII